MRKALVVLEKEWWELRSQRMLLLGIALLPVLIGIGAAAVFYAAGHFGDMSSGGLPPQVKADPAFAGMDDREISQTLVGKQFSVMLLLLPLFIPSVIAAHAIVGEKAARTLEPVLATPVRTSELLLGKSLIALVPALAISALVGGLFVAGVGFGSVSARVLQAVVTPGWAIVFVLTMPLLALTAIALTVLVSSRVNDARTAQQVTGVLVVPVLLLTFGQLGGVLILSPEVALAGSAFMAIVAFASLKAATLFFRREVILTVWK